MVTHLFTLIIIISDHKCNSKGGHLFEATVAVVGEFILRKINLNQKRKLDPNIGLACMSLNNKGLYNE